MDADKLIYAKHVATPVGSPSVGRAPAWRSRDVLRVTVIVLGVIVAARGLWAASTVVICIFLGVLFGLALSAGVDKLARLRVPRGLAAPLLLLVVLGLLVGLGALTAPRLISETEELRAHVPDAIRVVDAWTSAHFGGQTIGDHIAAGVTTIVPRVFGFVGSTIEVIAYLVLVLFTAVYFAVDPDLYQRGLMHLFPHPMRARTQRILSETATVLRKWLLTQLIAMSLLGTAWAVALSLLGVRAAFALAVIAGLLEFIPTIGPTLAVLPALVMALADSPGKVASVLVCYVIIQAIESNVIMPLLMQGRMDLPPALTIGAQALMTVAFGFLGLMVAVPVLATVLVPIRLLYVENVVGDVFPSANDHASHEAPVWPESG
jgi:predicted PurR-regulated permease PerM